MTPVTGRRFAALAAAVSAAAVLTALQPTRAATPRTPATRQAAWVNGSTQGYAADLGGYP
ncbi:hypothetical protein [Streptomyces subrutilus]|uniref:hypothetical protein n=1 Tax=Streptomyces subrutilus TaxID=36818 RepID=UPI0033E23D60